jgi:Cu(I)/Ag(I) efflux system protein CusF
MKTFSKLMLIAGFAISAPFSVHASSDSADPNAPAATETANQRSEGVVRKVNKDAKKITIRHGELKNLDMPPMTMVFLVEDETVLDQVNVGDEIDFVAEKVGGRFTARQIEVKK